MSLNVHTNVPYALSKYISYDFIYVKYQAYMSTFSNDVEPTTYAEAVKDPR